MGKPVWGEYIESEIFNPNITFLLCDHCMMPISASDMKNTFCMNCGYEIDISDLDLTACKISPSGSFVIQEDKKYMVYGKEMTITQLKEKYPHLVEHIKMLT